MVPREEMMIKKLNPEIANRVRPKLGQEAVDHLNDLKRGLDKIMRKQSKENDQKSQVIEFARLQGRNDYGFPNYKYPEYRKKVMELIGKEKSQEMLKQMGYIVKLNIENSKEHNKKTGFRRGKNFKANFRQDQKTALELLKSQKSTDQNNEELLKSGLLTAQTLANLQPTASGSINTEIINRARRELIYNQNKLDEKAKLEKVMTGKIGEVTTESSEI